MRWIFRSVILVLILIAIAVGGLFVVPTDRIAAIASTQFERATGRDLVISGEVRPSIFPMLGVRIGGVEISNPDWVADGPMIRADRLNVGVDFWSLLRGNVRVDEFQIVSPEIVLVQRADGVASWDFANAAPEADIEAATEDSGGPLSAFSLDLAEISSGRLLYRDEAGDAAYQLSDVTMQLRFPGAEEAAALEGEVTINGASLEIEALIDGVGPMLEGALRPVVIALRWSGGELGYDGQLGLSPVGAEGRFAFEATDLGPLMSLAGQLAPDLPQGLGRDRIAAEGDLTYASEGTLHLRGGQFAFDGNSLAGDIDILPGDNRPMVRARLQGGMLDLSGLAAGGGDSAGSGDSDGWSRSPIDVSGLFAVDAEAALGVSGLDLGLATFGAVDIRAGLENGRLVLNLRQVEAYGGSVTGQYIVNGRGGLSMRAAMNIAGVQLAPLLTEFADFDRLEGTGTGAVDLLMVGDSVHALMNSMSGSGQIEFGQGAILGLDIWGMIRTMDTSFRGEGAQTVYDQIAASFTASDGVIRNDDLAMTAPLGQVTGEGTVGMGQRVLDYQIVPQVVTGQDGAGVRVPLEITGPWSNLRYRLDLEALARQELADEIEALEEQATDAVADALGVEVDEGQSLEEAATETLEERLRDEAASQLQRLLGGN